MTTLRKFTALTLCGSILALGACGTTATTQDQSVETSASEKISGALNKAASAALQAGNIDQAVALLEKSYRRSPKDPAVATQYSEALRKSGKSEMAALVLKPFANAETVSVGTLTEYASVQLERGEYADAQKFAQKALDMESKSSEAEHVLAISLDAQGQHEQAETHFRSALDMWEGDPVPIMNNLALNLASQERISDAVDILKKAKSIAPNRVEIERNLRIISTLNEDPKAFKD